jgi:hypothetical protein
MTFLYSKWFILRLYIMLNLINPYYVKKMSKLCPFGAKNKRFFLGIKSSDFILQGRK